MTRFNNRTTISPSSAFWTAMRNAADRFIAAGDPGCFKRNEREYHSFWFGNVMVATAGGQMLGGPDKHGRLPIYADYSGKATIIEQITVEEGARGTGEGTKVMQRVQQIAATNGAQLYLHIHPTHATKRDADKTRKRLAAWYARLGWTVREELVATFNVPEEQD